MKAQGVYGSFASSYHSDDHSWYEVDSHLGHFIWLFTLCCAYRYLSVHMTKSRFIILNKNANLPSGSELPRRTDSQSW